MNASELIVAGLTFFSPALATTTDDKSDPVECLALNMYHEARGQGSAGLLGVSSVVLNRVRDKRFPNTICEVVEQDQHTRVGKPVMTHHCQRKNESIGPCVTGVNSLGIAMVNQIRFEKRKRGRTQ